MIPGQGMLYSVALIRRRLHTCGMVGELMLHLLLVIKFETVHGVSWQTCDPHCIVLPPRLYRLPTEHPSMTRGETGDYKPITHVGELQSHPPATECYREITETENK